MNKELLRMEHIITYRSSKKILDDAKLNLFQGELIGITSVNNAGKTALVGGIVGTAPITSGHIYIEEEEVSITSIEEGRKAGIYYFSRHSSLITDFTIWQNFLLGPNPGQIIIKSRDSEAQCREMLELLGIQVNIHEKISTLTQKEKLLVEMARAVYYDAKILVMDDILNTLSATALDEFELLFQMLCSLHIGIILIDNRIRCLKRYCSRLFVMRSGQTAAVLDKGNMDDNLITALMLGTKPAAKDKPHIPEPLRHNEVLLEMQTIYYQNILRGLSFQVFRNEITGVLNVGTHSGNAVNHLLQGRGKPDSGTLYFRQQPIVLKSAEHAVSTGIASLAEQDAIFPNLTLEENIMFPALKMNSRLYGILNKSELKYSASELMSRYIVNYEGIYISESQIEADIILRWKIYFCRMLSTSPELAVILNPTKSIDSTSKELLYDDIRSLSGLGTTALIISSNIEELFAVCDRILVVNHGKAEADIRNDESGREELLYLYRQYLKLM
ncbi:MAG: sugar ABC transporter ATP-binding protein [Ruminococcus sp.]|jgi:ribose transport system ATP-binding protein|nr:sugar ABC transporter ATP-binding protein [Ruminococcus sp.]